jgi:hypothetical protein
MTEDVIYLVEPKEVLLARLGHDADPDLTDLLAWRAEEGDGWTSDARLARVKIQHLVWLSANVDDLFGFLPEGSTLSLQTFDSFWTCRRIAVIGDVANFRRDIGKVNFDGVEPTGNKVVDEWIRLTKEEHINR